MLLVIDIGNTNIVLGLFAEKAIGQQGKNKPHPVNTPGERLITHWRISTDKFKTADEYGPQILELFHYAGLNPTEVREMVISSVVPSLVGTFEQLSKAYFKREPFVFRIATDSGMPVRYDNPKEVGTDRVANAFAAFHLYKKAAIIVDFGTATTFDVVTAKGEYAGGVIVPGMGISAEALSRAASKLPYVELVKPKKTLGKNTIESMQSGLIYGTVGQVNQIIKQLKKEIGGQPLIIATGGYAKLIGPEIKSIKIINPTLTLEGLALIYERNRKKRR
ncbi:MAG: type III pantothenate kinase [bacterium]